MQIDIGVRPFEESMLVPVGLTNMQYVTYRLQRWYVGWLVRRVSHHQQEVDFRFGGQSGYRGRADMLKHPDSGTKRDPNAGRLTLEKPRPGGIVFGNVDRAVQRHELPYMSSS